MRKTTALVAAVILLSVCSLSAAAITVTVSSPTNGSTTTSPVHFAASATSHHTITGWRIYVDSVSAYQAGQSATISTSVPMSPGSHQVVVRAWNSTGSYASASLTVNVPSTTAVGISVAPSTATLQAGVSQQFTASVTGTTNTAVSWYVNGVQGGNSTVGTISATGLYTAPSSVPSGGTATVTAGSAADTTKTASATVTITAAPAPVKVFISPSTATVQTGATQQFTSTVTGTTNTAVNWLVNGVPGGNTTVGTISSTGLYAAPATAPSGAVTVTATSSYDSAASASATISVTAAPTPVSVSISPTSVSLQTSSTKQFSASVTGTTNTSVVWSVNGVQGGNSTVGTISATGLYTAPAAAGTATVKATSVFNATASASASVTITAPAPSSANSLYVTPTGSDSNPCTQSAPCRTISRAASLTSPGYTVHVAAGAYNEHVVTTISGTQAAPITFVSDTQWGAKVDYVGCLPTSGAPSYTCKGSNSGWSNKANYVAIKGFDITTDAYIGIENDATHVLMLGNFIHDVANTGMGTATGPSVCNNAGMGIAGIDNTYAGNGYNTVMDNFIRDINYNGTAFCGNGGHGIYTADGYDVIENNIVFRGSGLGITQWHYATNTVIANNVAALFMDGITLGANSVTSNNNAVVNNILRDMHLNSGGGQGSGIAYGGGNIGTNNLISNNIVYGNQGQGCSGLTCTNLVTSDPMFVNYQTTGTSQDFHLSSGSPGVGKGTSTDAPTTDFAGAPRGSAIDIGAYQNGAAPAAWPWQ